MKVQVGYKLLVMAAVMAAITLTAPRARGDFMFGTALDYTVLVDAGAKSFQLNNATVNGDVGIGGGLGSGGVQIASNGFIKVGPAGSGQTGRLDLVDASATVSNPGNVAGGVHFSQSQVTTALSSVSSVATSLAGEAGTTLTISGGNQIVNASAGMLDANGNRVFTVASNGFNNNNQGFTINGLVSDYVVININNGTSNEAIGGPIRLSGGIMSDHVLFNFTGTSGNLGASAGGANVNGIFLAPNMSINIDNINIHGRLFGGRPGQDFQIVSGFNISVPEPASVLLLALGVVGILTIHRTQARSRAA